MITSLKESGTATIESHASVAQLAVKDSLINLRPIKREGEGELEYIEYIILNGWAASKQIVNSVQ